MRDGWKQVTLGELFAPMNDRLGDHDTEPEVFSVTKHDGIVRASDYFEKRIASRDLSTYKVVPPGAFVYSTIHIDEGSIARSNFDAAGVVSPMYTVMRVTNEEVDPRFLELALRAPRMLRTYLEQAVGTVNRRRSLIFKRFSQIKLDLPPPVEQRWIVDLVSSIDLAMRRTSDAVRALSAAQSSIRDEVLMSAPTRIRLGDCLESIDSGKSPKTLGRPPGVGERAVVALNAVQPARFLPAEAKAVDSATVMPEAARVTKGDVLMTRSNTPERVGFVCRVHDDHQGLYLSDLVLRLHATPDELDGGYLVHALSSTQSRRMIQGAASGTSDSMKKISRTKIREFTIPSFPVPEQREIGRLLDSFVSAAVHAESALESLRQVRGAALSDLLSGENSLPDSYDRFLEEVS
jgi:hypothetical protein